MAEKRIALVTGATGGLGTAIASEMVTEGFTVAANYRSKEKAEKWLSQLEDGVREGVHIFYGDVSDYDSVDNMVQEIEQRLGPIDVVVNNAGITRDKTLRKMGKEDWDGVIAANLTSVFNCSKHVIQGMIDRGYGRIINISSVNGQKGQIGQTNYAAAKAGIHGFTKSLAQEVATKGVTVNTISPGYVATDMVTSIPQEIIDKHILPTIPMHRLGGTYEIAHLVCFLASDKAKFITGADYSINGGQHMS